MGNLDLLIRLNNLFYSYETKELINDMSLIKDDKIQYKLTPIQSSAREKKKKRYSLRSSLRLYHNSKS